jgi:hypothetical protein
MVPDKVPLSQSSSYEDRHRPVLTSCQTCASRIAHAPEIRDVVLVAVEVDAEASLALAWRFCRFQRRFGRRRRHGNISFWGLRLDLRLSLGGIGGLFDRILGDRVLGRVQVFHCLDRLIDWSFFLVRNGWPRGRRDWPVEREDGCDTLGIVVVHVGSDGFFQWQASRLSADPHVCAHLTEGPQGLYPLRWVPHCLPSARRIRWKLHG